MLLQLEIGATKISDQTSGHIRLYRDLLFTKILSDRGS